mgnify:CR=1 FL=1
MKLLTTLFITTCLTVMPAVAAEPSDTVTVFMIGDSTMANKPLKKENQERGWGQMLPVYLQGKIKVDNHAVNGRSSKSFIDEGRWDNVMSLIRPGDYVIIQFGHNDEKIKSPDRYTIPGSTFDDNLRRFVNDTKSKGATPCRRRSFAFVSSEGYSYCPDLRRCTSSSVRKRQRPRLRFFFVRPA